MFEKYIEVVLKISPELIDPRFAGRPVESQMRRGRSRLDLMVKMPRGVIIAEIKRGVLSAADVRQVLAYCRTWALHHKHRVLHETFLVGFSPLNEAPLVLAAEGSVFKVRLRYLGKHVPLVVQEKKAGGYEKWDETAGRHPIRIAR